ncbi:hypothetical protein GFC01_06140 [Desulfofundulus thermobenzoicus]|uniref:Uncharacterized protein n=1 Tax=Desulfofundulus thermobenzoicus TaxID=29376 RepID=A0A6N7IPG1_9FIRM|nr:hypothetical protein [Desulfofundulus thermobenzoicus]
MRRLKQDRDPAHLDLTLTYFDFTTKWFRAQLLSGTIFAGICVILRRKPALRCFANDRSGWHHLPYCNIAAGIGKILPE